MLYAVIASFLLGSLATRCFYSRAIQRLDDAKSRDELKYNAAYYDGFKGGESYGRSQERLRRYVKSNMK